MTADHDFNTNRDGAIAASALAAQTTLSRDLDGSLSLDDLCLLYTANPAVLDPRGGPHTLANPWGGPYFELVTCGDDGTRMLAILEVPNV